MIYLVNNIDSKILIVSTLSDIPQDSNHKIISRFNSMAYVVNNVMYSKIITLPMGGIESNEIIKNQFDKNSNSTVVLFNTPDQLLVYLNTTSQSSTTVDLNAIVYSESESPVYVITDVESDTKEIFVVNYDYLTSIPNAKIIDNNYFINNTKFSTISRLPENCSSDQINQWLNKFNNDKYNIIKFKNGQDFLAYLIYSNVIQEIIFINDTTLLEQNKLKFIISIVKYNSKNKKELIAITNYVDLCKNKVSAFSIMSDSPLHHYEVYNYKTSLFIPYTTKLAATNLLEQLKNEFLTENSGVLV